MKFLEFLESCESVFSQIEQDIQQYKSLSKLCLTMLITLYWKSRKLQM